MASPVIDDTPVAAPDVPRRRASLRAVPPEVERPRGLVERHPAAASIIAAAASRVLVFAVALRLQLLVGRASPAHAPRADRRRCRRRAPARLLPLGVAALGRGVVHAHRRARLRTHATAFFPLYPLLARVSGAVDRQGHSGRRHRLRGLLRRGAACSCIASCATTSTRATAAWTVILLSFASTSFFFQAVYSESLFLLLTVASFSAARRGRWVLAGLAGGLAALTRSAGVLLLVPLAWMWFEQYRGGAIRLPGAGGGAAAAGARPPSPRLVRGPRAAPRGACALHGVPVRAGSATRSSSWPPSGTGTAASTCPSSRSGWCAGGVAQRAVHRGRPGGVHAS